MRANGRLALVVEDDALQRAALSAASSFVAMSSSP